MRRAAMAIFMIAATAWAAPAEARLRGSFAEGAAIAKRHPNDSLLMYFAGGPQAYKTGKVAMVRWVFGTDKTIGEATAFVTANVARGRLVESLRAAPLEGGAPVRVLLTYDDNTFATLYLSHHDPRRVGEIWAHVVPSALDAFTGFHPDGTVARDGD